MFFFQYTSITRYSTTFSPTLHNVCVALLSIAVLTTAACSGCNSRQTTQQLAEEEAERDQTTSSEKKRKKPRLEIERLQPLLGQEITEEAMWAENSESLDENATPLLIKPGHWMATVQRMKPNYTDFVGHSTISLLNTKNKPVPLEFTRFTLYFSRPVALAKGRVKRVEGEVFVPERTTATRLRENLTNRNTGNTHEKTLKLLPMPPYQYFVVVLAKEVSRYGFLKVTDTVRAPWEEEFEAAAQPHYRVVLADAGKSLPLSSNSLAWTTIAYLVWDEVDPTRLTSEQQWALVDWLHWGGRLVINGPDSLDTLRGSFLDEWLPVESSGSRSIVDDDLRQWSRYWGGRARGANVLPLVPTKPWSGLVLSPRKGTRELVGGGGLFYQREVGLGSVVVSAVQLAERDLVNWPGFDSFLNGGLLGRPRRQYSKGAYDGRRVDWADYRGHRLDAHFTTPRRLAARDVTTSANVLRVETAITNQFGQPDTKLTTQIDRPGGVGAWSAFSPVAVAAREVLTAAAAVRVPKAEFVIACLAVYLVVLVPINWMVFHSLRRVEWAWIAAPVIALLGTWVIARQAQLDIGFVRSQTEVGLLELHSPYERGLLSRYTALYSSLSTTYDVTFEESETVAAPFPASQRETRKLGDTLWQVGFEKHHDTQLRGLTVSSTSTRMLHSEQMFALDGPIRLGLSSRGHEQVENRTRYRLRDLMVVHRFFDDDGQPHYKGDWIGELRASDSAVLALSSIDVTEKRRLFAEERRQSAEEAIGERLTLDTLVDLALKFPDRSDPYSNRREEYRLVGVIDQLMPGTTVAPAASQTHGATVVLAHLRYGEPPNPEPDVNSRDDVIQDAPPTFSN